MSAIYAGTVRHRRFATTETDFTHRIALAYLDLDELPGLLGGRLVRRRPGLVRVRRRDLHGDAGVPPAQTIRSLVAERAGIDAGGPVRVLTQPRTLGHCFNPVSLYYCFAQDGQQVVALVAEVTNTPWGERHAYVLPCDAGQVMGGEAPKRLHVSPFMGMEQTYFWRATQPGPTLSVHLESREAGERAFDATLALHRRPLTARGLAAMSGGSLRTLALIYAHAARLGLAGVSVHPHPEARGT